MHSAVVVWFPSAVQGDGQGEELQEGDQGVHLQGEEEEVASQGACPLQGEDSFKIWVSLVRLI